MTLKSRMQEFGFFDIDRFPRILSDHAVSLSLPSALEHGISPVEIQIRRGLAIPAQDPGSANGVIVRSDGMILHVGHRDPKDPASPLEAKFIKDVPYDLRVELCNIMRRAVQAESSLRPLWDGILQVWRAWFPIKRAVPGVKQVGAFVDVSKAWEAVCKTIDQLLEKIILKKMDIDGVALKVVVQNESEARQGWLGEELIVDETLFTAIIKEGHVKYLRQHLFLKMQQTLKSPVFPSKSTFRLFYEPRSAHTIKLVVISPAAHAFSVASFGIELKA